MYILVPLASKNNQTTKQVFYRFYLEEFTVCSDISSHKWPEAPSVTELSDFILTVTTKKFEQILQ